MAARVLPIAVVLAMVTRAAAQPAVCGICTRGDELVEQLKLQPLRSIAGELAELRLDDPLTTDQYARVVALRQRAPVLIRLGAVDDADLAAIAAGLCKADADACVDTTARALRCLADRCEVALPQSKVDDLVASRCRQVSSREERLAPLGVGLEWGTGYQSSRYPHDGRAWSFGIETRLRLTGHRLGAVVRIDRVAGRDEATDVDRDGDDDVWSGSITRIYALGGPSFVLDHGHLAGASRYLRLDLLGGYASTRSQADESGPAAGFDLSYHFSILRFGVRFVQGFGDASDATMVLGHLGFVAGSAPSFHDDDDCDDNTSRHSSRSSRMAIGVDFPLIGYGISSELGLLVPGLAVELAWTLTRRFDVMTRADLLIFPGLDRERVIHQAALAGIRLDHGARRTDTGFFSTVMAGYTHGAGITPTTTGTGPIGDLSIGWAVDSHDFAGYFRLHGRFGIGPDNVHYRAIFLSGGYELRFDPWRWRYRN